MPRGVALLAKLRRHADAMRRVAEYEAKEAAKAAAEADGSDGEEESTQPDAEGELP